AEEEEGSAAVEKEEDGALHPAVGDKTDPTTDTAMVIKSESSPTPSADTDTGGDAPDTDSSGSKPSTSAAAGDTRGTSSSVRRKGGARMLKVKVEDGGSGS
ncbi:unnamed protein product, partial [Laminaria digitata]